MKKLIFLIHGIAIFLGSTAQPHAGEYMSQISSHYTDIDKDAWDYIKQVSRGRNARKIEKRRVELVNTLKTSRYAITRTASYNGDKSLRDGVADYLQLLIYSLNDDYRKIVDMESIAEESYDAMEAYLLTKERVNVKMDSAQNALNFIVHTFARQYDVRLVEGDTRISRKIKNSNAVMSYHDQIYLLFFKSYWYESMMMEAVTNGKVSDMEQYRQSLEITSKEGMDSLKKIDAYEGDPSLKQACFQMLEFYYGEAVKYMPGQVDFFIKKETMDKLTKAMETKNKKSITKEEADTYNQAVKDYNEAISSYNETNEYLNKYRSLRLENWSKTSDKFFDSLL